MLRLQLTQVQTIMANSPRLEILEELNSFQKDGINDVFKTVKRAKQGTERIEVMSNNLNFFGQVKSCMSIVCVAHRTGFSFYVSDELGQIIGLNPIANIIL